MKQAKFCQKTDIIFMGTPDFAAVSLKYLLEQGCRFSLVVTQPDRPKGRGRKLIAPPVKTAALDARCETAQPVSIKNDAFIQQVRHLKPDYLVVVAYGQILPQELLEIPRSGAINLHASLLPRYRGAAPIQWAIINGEQETGVTTILMDNGLDTGAMLLSRTEPIRTDDTAATLHDRLALIGAELLFQTLEIHSAGEITPTPQDDRQATYAPLLKKKDGRIDWLKPARQLTCQIRGMNPWPGAFTFYGDRRLKILAAQTAAMEIRAAPGTVIQGFADELRIATSDGALSILEIQGASGKRMGIKAFLQGCKMLPGAVLS